VRARSAVAASVVGLGVLAAAWRAGQQQGGTAGTVAATPAATGSASPAPSSAGGVRRVDGAVVPTPYGDVQVRAVLRHGVLTDVVAVHLTDHGPRSVEISARAAPILRGEARAARSAHIDTVSGASYTSDGYRRSLQYALDHAGG
jgi:uncharacterized protein with FMN-binding domain